MEASEPRRMSLDRGSLREGHGCIRARQRRSTTTHGETKNGSEEDTKVGAWLVLVVVGHGNMEGRGRGGLKWLKFQS